MIECTKEDKFNDSNKSQTKNIIQEDLRTGVDDNLITKTESENMEVHHHSHTSHRKKNWKSYFWEFLMLFLAVFCGFLAEYQLEHKIENERTKELALSFYEELKIDSASIVLKSANRVKQEDALKYLIKHFKDSSLNNLSKKFVTSFLYGINFRTPSLFEPRTAVLEQLKNSGSLRYFKNNELQKLIGDLSVAIAHINDRQSLESSIRLEYINPIMIRHYDFDFQDQLTQNGNLSIFDAAKEYESNSIEIPFHLKYLEKIEKQYIVNNLSNYCFNALNSTRTIHYNKYIDLNTKLLAKLREEYRLK